MTRASFVDRHGRKRRPPAWHVPATIFVGAALFAALVGLGVWWVLAALAALLTGRMAVDSLDRTWTRSALRRDARPDPVSPTPALTPALTPEQAALADKIASMGVTADAGLPWVDYEAGEIWPVDRQRDWLKTNQAVDGTNRNLDRRAETLPAPQPRLSPTDQDQIDNQWLRDQGNPRVPWVPYPAGTVKRLPSGRYATGAEINRTVQWLRDWGEVVLPPLYPPPRPSRQPVCVHHRPSGACRDCTPTGGPA